MRACVSVLALHKVTNITTNNSLQTHINQSVSMPYNVDIKIFGKVYNLVEVKFVKPFYNLALALEVQRKDGDEVRNTSHYAI